MIGNPHIRIGSKKRKGIRLQLKLREAIVLAVILGLLLPVTIMSLFTLDRREKALTEQLRSDHQRLTELLAVGAQEALWSLDKDSLRRLADSLQSDTRVVSYAVRDMRLGVVLAETHAERRVGRQSTLERDIVRKGKVIGTATVEMDSGQSDAAIADDRRIFLVTAGAQLLLSIVLVVVLLHSRLLQPIKRLMRESEKLAQRHLTEPFFWARHDELGSLGHSLERTRQALQSLFGELETKNTQLGQDIARRVQVEAELERHRDELNVSNAQLKVEIADHERAEARIRHLAQHDALTELPNRLLFNDRVNHAIAEAKRKLAQTAVLFIDLDRFKNINDSLGHDAGDQLLRAVAQRLQECLRETDSLARVGGDEFVITVGGLHGRDDVARVAANILKTLRQPFRIGNHELHSSGSIGISLYPDNGDEAGALVRAADTAMYFAKEQGRDTYQFFTPGMHEETVKRTRIANRLHRALELREFVLHYQPQLDLESGRIYGAEALIRWYQEDNSVIPPDEFIRIAEETGFIVRLGEWVLREACEQLARWRKAGFPDLRIAVNLSPQQILRPGFPAMVAAILEQAELPAAALELEITEGILTTKSQDNIATLEKLAASGVQLAIDDFGTGYSSLSYLQRFPLHALKIDQSFVAGIGRDANDTAIVTAIIAMAQSLRLKVVAEGVETGEQAGFLKARGCLAAQGFYFSAAVTAENFMALLQRPVKTPVLELVQKPQRPM